MNYNYFGNCINTVDVDEMWDATQMAQFLETCQIIELNDVKNNLNNGNRRLPKILMKHIAENPELLECSFNEYQKIMVIYDTINDIHYFF